MFDLVPAAQPEPGRLADMMATRAGQVRRIVGSVSRRRMHSGIEAGWLTHTAGQPPW